MKRIVMLMTMAATTVHAAINGVSVVDVCDVPKQVQSSYNGMLITISNGISVVCNTPESLVMYYDVKVPVSITVSNGTKNAIPFYRNEVEAYRGQLWIDLGDREQFYHPPAFGLKPDKQWNMPFDPDKWPAERLLGPGEEALWKLEPRHVMDILNYASEHGTSNITVRIQTGQNRWASSETKPLHVVPRALERAQNAGYWAQYKVAEFESIDAEQNKPKKASFFVIPVKGTRTLFDHKSQEVCALTGNETPTFQHDKKSGVVSISLPNRKQIRYDLQKAKVVEHQEE